MLVKKTAISKRTKILLIILVVVLLPGGYFAYRYFFGSSPETEQQTTPEVQRTPEVVIPTFEDTVFQDPQLFSLQRKKFTGFTEQLPQIILSGSVPLAPKHITVQNQATGQTLLIQWELPDYRNFNRVRLYRSSQASRLGEAVATLDVVPGQPLGSYRDAGLVNGQTYYYLARTVNQDGDESTNALQESGVPTDEVPPAPPLTVQVSSVEDERGEQAVEVAWMNPPDQDFAAVRIYRSAERGTVGTAIYEGVGEGKAGSAEKRAYLDSDIEANIIYYYTVTSLDKSGNESTKDILANPYNHNPFLPLTF